MAGTSLCSLLMSVCPLNIASYEEHPTRRPGVDGMYGNHPRGVGRGLTPESCEQSTLKPSDLRASPRRSAAGSASP